MFFRKIRYILHSNKKNENEKSVLGLIVCDDRIFTA